MYLLPHLEEQINSKKTPEDIYTILSSVTDSRKVILSTDAEFIGQVRPLDFKIVPMINYRNSFLPILIGKITENEEGAVIDITLKMNIFTRIVLILGLGMDGFLFLIGILAAFIGGLEDITLFLVLFGSVILGWIIARCGFYGPARKAVKRLNELLG